MDGLPRFTVSDITALREAQEALNRIDCTTVSCTVCPLHLEHKGCIANQLGYIAREAELEGGLYYGA